MTLQLGGGGAITGCTSLQEPDLIVSGLTVNGDIDAPKVIVASGTNALPSYTFSGDIDTGLYAPAANTVGISTGGNEHLRIDSVGNVGIGISNPDFNCHIAGTGTDLLKIQRSGAGGGARFRMINGDANYYDIFHDGAEALGIQFNGSERMRIDSAGNVGIGTSSPSRLLELKSSAPIIRLTESTNTYSEISANSSVLSFKADESNGAGSTRIDFRLDGSEAMRIDSSGNVGIGTSSPSARFNVTDTDSSSVYTTAASLAGQTSIYKQIIHTNQSSGTNEAGILLRGGVDASATEWGISAVRTGTTIGDLTFRTRTAASTSAERMRIDSSGNVGIGTTSPTQKLHIVGTSNVLTKTSNGTAAVLVGIDSSNDGVIKLETSNNLKLYTSNTERLRIDSSGRVGIGTSSPDAELHVGGSDPHIDIGPASGNRAKIAFDSNNIYIATSSGTGQTIFKNNVITTDNPAASGTERMRIDGAGNVGIGTSSPSELLEIKGSNAQFVINGTSTTDAGIEIQNNGTKYAEIKLDTSNSILDISQTQSSGKVTFSTGSSGTERMRIDTSGSLLVGRSSSYNSAPGEMAVFQGTRHGVVIFQAANANYTCLNLRNAYANNGGNNVSGNMITFHDNGGTERGKISINGSSTSYITSSDYRLKENVVDIADGITRIKQLQPKRFNFIADADTTVDGFLAHEAQAVVPEAITGTKDEVDDDGDAVMQGIDQSKLVPLLTAALQEAIAKIETLEQRLTDAGL
jgi:hypothetical protein